MLISKTGRKHFFLTPVQRVQEYCSVGRVSPQSGWGKTPPFISFCWLTACQFLMGNAEADQSNDVKKVVTYVHPATSALWVNLLLFKFDISK